MNGKKARALRALARDFGKRKKDLYKVYLRLAHWDKHLATGPFPQMAVAINDAIRIKRDTLVEGK